MKDIDFDELDRAVNSLVNPEPTEAPVISPVAPVVETPVSVPTPPPVAAAPLAARRSSGRFMDVVHPSSDMRTAVPQRPVVQVAPAPIVAPVVSPISTDMPDPLDFTPGAQESNPVSVSSTSDADMTSIADDSNALPADEPLDSPFITDAKVEKRPLGAFSGAGAVETVSPVDVPVVEFETPADEPLSERSLDTSDDHPIGNDTPLPAELQGDVLSIEAAEETAAAKLEDTEVLEPVAPVITAAAVVAAETPIGPTSITQQYTEQASTGDQPVGSIFDTEAYKKPLAHPKKKKSGWLMVLWIFLLLIIGAGAGAAVYFYVLPLL